MLVTVELEGELAGAGLLDLLCVGKVERTAWSSLVLAVLVEEEQALAGLAGPGSGGAGGVLALGEVGLEVRGLDWLLAEPEEDLLGWDWQELPIDDAVSLLLMHQADQ